MKWLKLMLGGQMWAVWLVSPKSLHLRVNEARCLGVCNYDKCKIYIANGISEPVFEDTLLHELLHASIYVSGGTNVLDAAIPNSDDSTKAEEQLIRCLTPVFHRLLKDLAFQFPTR